MESTRTKRKSFTKSKLIKSIYRSTKPSNAVVQPSYSSKTKPSPSNNSPTAAGFIIVNQDQAFTQQKPKVAFVVPERNRDSYGKLENFYGGPAEDEAVDAKATRYISSVQERFRLERVSPDRNKLDNMQL